MGLETIFGTGAITSKLNKVINWGRKYSFFPFPFVTACCGMEFMATWGSHYDVARFGAEFPAFFAAPGRLTDGRRHHQP